MDFSAEMEVFKVSDDGYFEDVDAGTPYSSAPTSPRHAFSKEVIEAPLGEVLAAIPFAWEVVPGTPKLESEHFSFSDETTQGSSSPSSSDESSARESTEFEFSNRIGGDSGTVSAEELFAKGQLVTSLRLPPRLQAVKHRDSDVSSCDSSSSFKSYSSPQSSPRGFCGFTKTADEETTTTTTILGMQEHNKHRSLSPLRFFHRESSFSSNSSSSSSSPSSNVSSPDSVTLKQLIFPDSPVAPTPKPPLTLKEASLTPQFSRSHAKSRYSSITFCTVVCYCAIT